MHAVVNHLTFKPETDWAELTEKFNGFFERVAVEQPKLRSATLVKSGPEQGIFIGIYDDYDTMRHVSSNIAAPWFAENIRPHLAGQAQRSEGEIIAGRIF